MKALTALEGGIAGAIILTSIHEVTKKSTSNAPQMDLLGMNALSKVLTKSFKNTPNSKTLFLWTLAGDLVANSLYYSLSGIGNKKNLWIKAGFLGIAAGAGAILLPKPLGLNPTYSNRTRKTQLLTMALYLGGSMIAATAMKFLERNKK